MDKKNIYITTAIDYVNAQPHVGHALEKVQADVLARYWRGQGKKVFFLTGTDEHGSKIVQTAKAKGIEPQALADINSQKFQELLKVYNISNDDFIRTSDQQRHWPAVVKMWGKLVAKGDIEKGVYQGLYCVGCEDFLTEKGLVAGKCPNHDKEPEKISETNYFFKLGNYAKQIIKKIESGEMMIVPDSRQNEILNILKDGYDQVSFSRPKIKLNWGVPVPGDDEQVMYVWPDALTNYISALGYWEETEQFELFWNNAYIIHIIGKDILRFHAAIWPAMLLSAGVKLPDKIFTHGFITSEGKKMSKSLGNVIDPIEIVKDYGVDPVRYYLLKEIPATADGDFSQTRFKEVYTADLANGLGNLLSRTTNMIASYLGGQVDVDNSSNFNWQRIDEYTVNQEYDKALAEMWVIIDEANKKIDDVKPWALAKGGKEGDLEKIKELLNELGMVIKDLAIHLKPYLPETADKILKIITADMVVKAEPLFPRLK